MGTISFLLEARSIVKSFGPTSVLRGVDFLVAPGEVHALLGGNGAGKSTLLKIVTGDLPHDGGTLAFAGHDLNSQAGAEARARLTAVVHQELALLPHLSVAENIALPRCPRGLALFRPREARRFAAASLALIDPSFVNDAIEKKVANLSLHERQLVEIARAIGSGAQLLLLDEPTANLTAAEAERLFGILRRLLVEQSIGVVFVSHRMREIRQVADVCTILRDGVASANRVRVDALTDAEIIERMGQQSAISSPPPCFPSSPSATAAPARTRSFRLEGPGVAINLTQGRIVGLAGGPTGPTSLIDTLIGEVRGSPWKLIRDGVALAPRNAREAARMGIGYISGDRSNKGIIAALPIVDNVMASRRVVRRRVLVGWDEPREARRVLETLNAGTLRLWALPAVMSGGTQQKLLIARWLGLRPQLLVLEEPTRGVDIGTKREIYALIRGMAAQGSAVIWWSTEHAELISLCEIVVAFDAHGNPTGVLAANELSDERLGAATGMAA
jgi:ribose transport system ATP-binding protein